MSEGIVAQLHQQLSRRYEMEAESQINVGEAAALMPTLNTNIGASVIIMWR